MERFTISLDENLAIEFDQLIRERGDQDRSEAVYDQLRSRSSVLCIQEEHAPFGVASLSHVYNHHHSVVVAHGARHGRLNMVPVEMEGGHPHVHTPPKT